VKNLLLSEEARLKEETVKNRNALITLNATTTGATTGGPTGGNRDGKGRKKKCYYCGKEGHFRRDCFKLKAEEESKDSKDSKGSSKGKVVIMVYRLHRLTTTWYIDSGVSDHFIGDRLTYSTFQDIPPIEVTIGDKSRIWVTGKGLVEIPLKCGKDVVFTDVLYSE
jgi:hypothetical protein